MSYFMYLLVVGIFGLSMFFKSTKVKGLVGEFRVNRALKKNFDNTEYILIKNVTIYDDKGTTQIDHLIVSRYGIFVIETKNLKGWIFGSPQQKKWTQSIYRKKYHFQNPIRQNYRHIKALESALTLENQFLIPVIVFVGNCTLKTDMPDNVVSGLEALIKFIKSVDKVQISDSQLPVLVERIEGIRLSRGFTSDMLHIKNLQNEGKHRGNTGNIARNVWKTACTMLLVVVGILLLLDQLKNSPKQNVYTTANGFLSTNKVMVPATQPNPTKQSMGKQSPPLYVIELKSGGSLYAKNLVRTKNTIAYDDGKGLITSLSRTDVLEIRKLR